MQPIRVCSYNMGSGPEDRAHVLCYNKIKLNKWEECLADYEEAQQQTATRLADIKADVYLLQEVQNLKRPLIRKLLDSNYSMTCHPLEQNIGTAIAFNEERFDCIEAKSLRIRPKNGRKQVRFIPIVVLLDKISKNFFCFSSIHAPGFNYSAPNKWNTQGGDEYCRIVALRVQEIARGRFTIIGGDFNASPDVWKPRFEIFEKYKFDIHRKGTPTNLNYNDSNNNERELDYFLTSSMNGLNYKLLANVDPLGWTPHNSSDHNAIFGNIYT